MFFSLNRIVEYNWNKEQTQIQLKALFYFRVNACVFEGSSRRRKEAGKLEEGVRGITDSEIKNMSKMLLKTNHPFIKLLGLFLQCFLFKKKKNSNQPTNKTENQNRLILSDLDTKITKAIGSNILY